MVYFLYFTFSRKELTYYADGLNTFMFECSIIVERMVFLK